MKECLAKVSKKDLCCGAGIERIAHIEKENIRMGKHRKYVLFCEEV